MSTTWEDVAQDMAMEEFYREKYEQELIDKALKDISETSVRNYLGKYGDAAQKRIDYCISQAKNLFDQKFFGASLVSSATSIELIIRFMLLQPLLQSAFLFDEWADILTKRIATGRTAEDKDLLPAVLRRWDIDITKLVTSTGKPLWENVTKLWDKRNDFIHQALQLQECEAQDSLDCAKTLLATVGQIAEKLGFTLNVTGKWCEISGNDYFEPESPFRA